MFGGGSPTVFLGHFRCRGSAFIYKSHGIFPLSSVSWFLSLVLCGLLPSGNSRLPLFRDPFLLISSSMLLIFRRPFFYSVNTTFQPHGSVLWLQHCLFPSCSWGCWKLLPHLFLLAPVPSVWTLGSSSVWQSLARA